MFGARAGTRPPGRRGGAAPAAPKAVLAISRLRPGARVEDLAFYDAADAEVFAAWTRAGVAAWPLARGDRAGLVLVLRLGSGPAAAAAVAGLPSVAAGLLAFDLVPLAPFRSWRPCP